MLVRFRLQRLAVGSLVNPNATVHHFGSLLLQSSDVMLDAFVRIQPLHSLSGQSYVGSHCDVQGMQLVDILYKDGIVTQVLLDAAVAYVNSHAVGFRVDGWFAVSEGAVLSGSMLNVVKIESALPVEVWQFAGRSYAGSVLRLEGDKYKLYYPEESLLSLIMRSDGHGGSVGYMYTPLRWGLWYHLQAYLKPKRVHPNQLYRHTRLTVVSVVSVMRPEDGCYCRYCGSATGLYDVGYSRDLGACLSCMCRRM